MSFLLYRISLFVCMYVNGPSQPRLLSSRLVMLRILLYFSTSTRVYRPLLLTLPDIMLIIHDQVLTS